MDNVEPTSYTQALKDPKWWAAIMEEFKALIMTLGLLCPLIPP
jgi:hypothetical protein